MKRNRIVGPVVFGQRYARTARRASNETNPPPRAKKTHPMIHPSEVRRTKQEERKSESRTGRPSGGEVLSDGLVADSEGARRHGILHTPDLGGRDWQQTGPDFRRLTACVARFSGNGSRLPWCPIPLPMSHRGFLAFPQCPKVAEFPKFPRRRTQRPGPGR